MEDKLIIQTDIDTSDCESSDEGHDLPLDETSDDEDENMPLVLPLVAVIQDQGEEIQLGRSVLWGLTTSP